MMSPPQAQCMPPSPIHQQLRRDTAKNKCTSLPCIYKKWLSLHVHKDALWHFGLAGNAGEIQMVCACIAQTVCTS